MAKSKKFQFKLWRIVNHCRSGAVKWSKTGDSIIFHFSKFQKEYLEANDDFCKSSNISSFIRQLNLYGFRKLIDLSRTNQHRQDEKEYVNPYFVKGRPDLLNELVRKPFKLFDEPNVHIKKEVLSDEDSLTQESMECSPPNQERSKSNNDAIEEKVRKTRRGYRKRKKNKFNMPEDNIEAESPSAARGRGWYQSNVFPTAANNANCNVFPTAANNANCNVFPTAANNANCNVFPTAANNANCNVFPTAANNANCNVFPTAANNANCNVFPTAANNANCNIFPTAANNANLSSSRESVRHNEPFYREIGFGAKESSCLPWHDYHKNSAFNTMAHANNSPPISQTMSGQIDPVALKIKKEVIEVVDEITNPKRNHTDTSKTTGWDTERNNKIPYQDTIKTTGWDAVRNNKIPYQDTSKTTGWHTERNNKIPYQDTSKTTGWAAERNYRIPYQDTSKTTGWAAERNNRIPYQDKNSFPIALKIKKEVMEVVDEITNPKRYHADTSKTTNLHAERNSKIPYQDINSFSLSHQIKKEKIEDSLNRTPERMDVSEVRKRIKVSPTLGEKYRLDYKVRKEPVVTQDDDDLEILFETSFKNISASNKSDCASSPKSSRNSVRAKKRGESKKLNFLTVKKSVSTLDDLLNENGILKFPEEEDVFYDKCLLENTDQAWIKKDNGQQQFNANNNAMGTLSPDEVSLARNMFPCHRKGYTDVESLCVDMDKLVNLSQNNNQPINLSRKQFPVSGDTESIYVGMDRRVNWPQKNNELDPKQLSTLMLAPPGPFTSRIETPSAFANKTVVKFLPPPCFEQQNVERSKSVHPQNSNLRLATMKQLESNQPITGEALMLLRKDYDADDDPFFIHEEAKDIVLTQAIGRTRNYHLVRI